MKGRNLSIRKFNDSVLKNLHFHIFKFPHFQIVSLLPFKQTYSNGKTFITTGNKRF